MLPSKPISPQQVSAIIQRFEQRLPKITADAARSVLARVQGVQPRPFRQFVDGREDAPLDSVKPGGNIRFLFGKVGPALEWIYAQLRERSPVGPERGEPHYRDVHWLFIDGARVPAPTATMTVRAIAKFINARPYARRLEHGWSFQAPDGVYELVALAAEQRFPDSLIEFSYSSPGEVPQPIPWRVRPYYGYPTITVRARSNEHSPR